MEVLTGVLVDLLPKLVKMLADEYNLHNGAKEGIKNIQKELPRMQGALEEMSQVSSDRLDMNMKLWARQLRDMSYKIEDTVDSYMVTFDPSAAAAESTCCVRGSRDMLPRTFMARRNIATEIERIRKEVIEVAELRERYKIEGISVARPPELSDSRLSDLYQHPSKLVGNDRTEHIKQLLSMEDNPQPDRTVRAGISSEKRAAWRFILDRISNSKRSPSEEEEKKILLRLVAIVGLPGIGKTTLAHAVYQKHKDDFDCTAFVSVSRNPNGKNILSSILRQVNSGTEHVSKAKAKAKSILRQQSHQNDGNTDSWSEKEISDKIREILGDRRYLIVIDDIWDESAWKYLKSVLVSNGLSSKIITTTRHNDVAQCCHSYDNVDGKTYNLEPLCEAESEKLFYRKVFNTDKCRPGFEDISSKIVGKCRGCPLAIVSIAGLLANKAKDQWDRIYDTRLQNINGLEVMWSILFVSYCDMPFQLRACFLYLSIFPEDHLIGRDDLIWRWIAEGFIRGNQDGDINNLYEVGDEYFNELINRNMILPAQVDTLGMMQTYIVHDIVLEYSNRLSDEEGFITVLNGQTFPSEPDNIHRMCLLNTEEEKAVPKRVKRLPHVRTLVLSSLAAKSMPSLSIFPVLRVLDLEGCTSHNLKDVGFLVLLRYLRLSQAHYKDLPQGIEALKFLQILDLKGAMIQGVPSTLVQLIQLSVLKISLYRWDRRYEELLLQCLRNLKKLEALYISAPANVSLDFMSMVDWVPPILRRFMTHFHKQHEHVSRLGSIWRELSSFSTLPRWINSSLSNLSDLSTTVRKLQQEDVEILAQFPNLITLDLEVVQACEEGNRLVINGHESAFQRLSNLKFSSRAMGLLFTPGAMQNLRKLYLCFSLADTKEVHFNEKDVGDFNFGLENLTSLKAVEVATDCRGAWRGELEAAEAAWRTAVNGNLNQSYFGVRRYFEGEMLPAAPRRLETLTIRSGDVIDSLAFSYSDPNGKQYNAGPWGDSGGDVHRINLGPSEYLTQVSGSNGTIWGLDNILHQVTFVTNVASYGPYGNYRGENQFVAQAPTNSCIISFFATAEKFVKSVRFYTRPL